MHLLVTHHPPSMRSASTRPPSRSRPGSSARPLARRTALSPRSRSRRRARLHHRRMQGPRESGPAPPPCSSLLSYRLAMRCRCRGFLLKRTKSSLGCRVDLARSVTSRRLDVELAAESGPELEPEPET
jgi:hypothetical protein